MSERVPAPRASRPAVGVRARTAAKPLGAGERSGAKTVALDETQAASVASVAAALPDPAELEPGTYVLLPDEIAAPRSLARSVLAVFGRTKTIPRARRCTALVARGYVEVGAAEGDDDDLAWGRAPERDDPEGAET